MLIDFEDKLDNGRAVVVSATQFAAPDRSVGYGGWPEDMTVNLDGTGFPVSITDAEEERFGNRLMDLWEDATAHDLEG